MAQRFIGEDQPDPAPPVRWMPSIGGRTPDETLVYLTESLRHLRKHATDLTPQTEIRVAQLTQGRLHIQVWWLNCPSVITPIFLWDLTDTKLPSDTNAEAFLDTLAHNGFSINREAEPNLTLARQKAPTLGFKYHPVRFRSHHQLGKIMAQAGTQSTHTAFTKANIDTALAASMNSQEPTGFPVRDRVSAPEPRETFAGTAMLGVFFADYVRAGSAIYDIPAALLERFKQTDVDDVPLSQLKLPYPALYVYFGPQADLAWYEGWPVEGAYIVETGGLLQVCLTCSPPDVQAYHRSTQAYEPKFNFAFSAEKMRLNAGLAIDELVAARAKELRDEMSGNTDFARSMAELNAAGLGAVNKQATNAAREMALLPRKHAALSGALKLIVNSLSYLTAYPEDSEEQWSEGAPPALLQRLSSDRLKVRRKAHSELLQHGHTLVRLAGKRFRANTVPGSIQLEGEAAKATWVRGHWVNQAYGPKWMLRRLRWKMPFVRGTDKGQPATSHIYLMDEQDTEPDSG